MVGAKRDQWLKAIAVCLACLFVLAIPAFVRSPYYLDLFIMIIVRGMLAITFVMLLRSGMINLGIAAFWGIGGYVSALLVMKLHVPFWASLPASAVITGIIALLFGFILIGSGSTGFSFVILSSIIGMLFSVVVGNISFLGGYNGISNIPAPEAIKLPSLPAIEFSVTNKAPYYYLAVVLLVLVVLACRALYASRIGRAWTCIGLNPRLAESLGVSIFRYKLAAFVVASAIAGLVGSFFAHYATFVTPDAYGMWVNMYIQLYAILGGIGYAIAGPLLGSGVMTFLPESMRVTSIYSNLVTGVILILLILYLPNGLLGLLEWRKAATARSVEWVKARALLLSARRRDRS